MKKQMQNVRKIKRKVLSLILVTALVTTGLNLDTMSQSIYASQTQKNENRKTQEKVTVVKELVDERTENSNTYLLSDGAKKTEIYSENIRYEENGKMVDYDTTLQKPDKTDRQKLNRILKKDNAGCYTAVNAKGDSRQYFPKELDEENGIVMNNGKYMLAFAPIYKQKERKRDNSEDGRGETEQRNGIIEAPVAEINNDTITYETEERGIRYRYTSMANGVKEDIILESKPETNEFAFEIDTAHLQLELLEGCGGINLKDKETGETVGYIMPPDITDGEDNRNCEDVKYILEKTEKETILKLVVNESYFDNENLVYPVKIDPTPVWFSDRLSTAVVCSASVVSGVNLHGENLYVNKNAITTGVFRGSEQRVYLDTSRVAEGDCFVQGPGNIVGKYIEKAELSIAEAGPKYPSGRVEIRKAGSKWNPQTITWNNQPEMGEEVIGSFTCEGTENTRHSIDLTEWAQRIADGEEDRGLVFTAEEGKGGGFKGPELTHQGYMWLSVTYRDMSAYDASVELSAEYNPETGKIETQISDRNELPAETTISGYKIYERSNDASDFSAVYKGENISEPAQIDLKGADRIDLRACILYSDGRVRPSNIVSFKKTEEADESGQDDTLVVTYEQTSFDTDGDGLEDGYEIWDFKTKWNEKKADGTYNQDSDGDGLPDGYEVFTMGTDPMIASTIDEKGEEVNSDGDDWSDLKEYEKGTDPWLRDSDFDEKEDGRDITPRKTNGHTSKAVATEAKIYKGLYDKEYSIIENGITVTYISNIYRGDIKSIYYNYGDVGLNKKIKYFYDADGNKTAVIEEYDKGYYEVNNIGPSQTVCITYSYRDGRVEQINDQKTTYSMSYDENGNMTNLDVGGVSLVNYQYSDNYGVEEKGTNDNSKKIEPEQCIAVYNKGTVNEQSIKTITTKEKKVINEYNEKTVDVIVAKIYYNGKNSDSYETWCDNEGNIIKLIDKTSDTGEDITYNYTYTDNSITVIRQDGFTKNLKTVEDESENKIITTAEYSFKDVLEENTNYVSTVTSDKNINEDSDIISIVTKLYNGDKLNYNYGVKSNVTTKELYSNLYNKTILKTTSTVSSNVKSTYAIDIYAEDKDLDYIYDLAGNITEIKINGKIAYKYSYDPHGRLISEKDFIHGVGAKYGYDSTSNILSITRGRLNENNNIVIDSNSEMIADYGNANWPDQLTEFDGKSVTYDNVGNPLEYLEKYSFTWSKGRQLSKITDKKTQQEINLKYNESGLRIYKDTDKLNTEYTWDEGKLLREQVVYKATGKKYDIWYFFDNMGEVVGFEYSYIGDDGTKEKNRIYYEKDMQGNVIGLLDSRGAEIATYAYDAWGNLVEDGCKYYNGYKVPYELNHFKYRSYYRDEETGFYYLQSRYYDAQICRFINADDVEVLGVVTTSVYRDNLYAYCNSDPINETDESGYFSIPRGAVSFVLDAILMAIPVVGAAMAPVKSFAKIYGRTVLKTKLRLPLSTLIRKVAGFARKVIDGITKVVKKIPFVGKSLAKKIPVNKLVNMIAGGTSSVVINSMLNFVVKNISMLTSVGGFVAGMLDYISDKKLDGYIKIY